MPILIYLIFNGGDLSGNVDGQGGVNTLDYATLDGPISVTLNATGGTTGFAGGASQISGVFDDINTLIGSKGSGYSNWHQRSC